MGNQEPAPKSSRPKDPCGGTIPARFDPSTREETWPNDGKSMENPWKTGETMANPWKIHGKRRKNSGFGCFGSLEADWISFFRPRSATQIRGNDSQATIKGRRLGVVN